MAQILRTTTVAALAALSLASSEISGEPTISARLEPRRVLNDAEPLEYTIGGACDVEGGIDGLTFRQEGVTHKGAPYFKALDSEHYMYYDPDCEGGSEKSVVRWVIDSDKPDLTKDDDLDSDSDKLACHYIASIESNDPSHPPLQAEWTINCDDVVEQHVLTLDESVPAEPLEPIEGGQSLTWKGACTMKSFVNEMTFDEVGATLDKRPVFRARDRNEYIFYDADCDGEGTTFGGRWILDNHPPSLTASEDLDGDHKCDYHARWLGDDERPPAEATWYMYCGDEEGSWRDVEVTLDAEEAGDEPDESTEDAEDAKAHSHKALRHKAINAAARNTVFAAVAALAVALLSV